MLNIQVYFCISALDLFKKKFDESKRFSVISNQLSHMHTELVFLAGNTTFR